MKKAYKNTIFFFLVSLILLLTPLNVWRISAQSKEDFKIYNALMNYDLPDLSDYGLSKINMIYDDSILDRNKNDIYNVNISTINRKRIEKEVKKINPRYPICFDVESWYLDDFAHLHKSVPKYLTLIKEIRRAMPNIKFGYYGVVPHADIHIYQEFYPVAEKGDRQWLNEWKIINRKIINIARKTDILYPSCYTRSKNIRDWMHATSIQINKAKEMNPNAPVYVFIWPQYYAAGKPYNNDFIDEHTWYSQLEFLYKNCDGIVIWGPPFNLATRVPLKWDFNAKWWIATQKFIKKYNIKSN